MQVLTTRVVALSIGTFLILAGGASAQAPTTPAPPAAPAAARQPVAPTTLPASIPLPPDYRVGPGDVLSIVFWRDPSLTGDVIVRPDGKISLPLLNDIQASGLTPDALRVSITESASKFVTDPTVHVIVKDIKSRWVYITGMVSRPGPYPIMGPLTVLQLIATAGGVLDFADKDNIAIIRVENGQPVSYVFKYSEVSKRRNLKQNIELKPGDSIVVP